MAIFPSTNRPPVDPEILAQVSAAVAASNLRGRRRSGRDRPGARDAPSHLPQRARIVAAANAAVPGSPDRVSERARAQSRQSHHPERHRPVLPQARQGRRCVARLRRGHRHQSERRTSPLPARADPRQSRRPRRRRARPSAGAGPASRFPGSARQPRLHRRPQGAGRQGARPGGARARPEAQGRHRPGRAGHPRHRRKALYRCRDQAARRVVGSRTRQPAALGGFGASGRRARRTKALCRGFPGLYSRERGIAARARPAVQSPRDRCGDQSARIFPGHAAGIVARARSRRGAQGRAGETRLPARLHALRHDAARTGARKQSRHGGAGGRRPVERIGRPLSDQFSGDRRAGVDRGAASSRKRAISTGSGLAAPAST